MMKLKHFFLLAIVASCLFSCERDPHTYAIIETGYGNMKVMLYNTTPRHRDNFIKLAREGFYDGLLFHRVINGYMIQGGDPNSRNAPAGASLGQGDPGYTLEPEIGAPHLNGALAAARLPDAINPKKESSGSQFYVVQGQPVDDNFLDQVERQKGLRYNVQQRELYKQLGGAPMLDNDYTVFGEVVEGIEVVDKIAVLPTDPYDRPNQDVKMNIRILN